MLSIGCHFLSQVKRNCPVLWQAIAEHTRVATPISTHEYDQKGHGRHVYRQVELYGPMAEQPSGWNGIQRVVKVRRWGTRQGTPFDETAFYVLSKPMDAADRVAKAIQSHWTIENNLHWAKDVNMKEDATTLRKHSQVSLLIQLNNVIVNTLTINGYKVIKNTFAKFANKVNELAKLFQNQGNT